MAIQITKKPEVKIATTEFVPEQHVPYVPPVTPDPVMSAVDKAIAEGKDPYLAGIAAKEPPKKGGIQITVRPKPYTILDACRDLHTGTKKGTLTIIRSSDGMQYIVQKYDPDTGKALLKGENGKTFAPKLAEREAALYVPIWR